MSYLQQQHLQQQAARPQSYADGYSNDPVGTQPSTDRTHGRSRSLLSGFRNNNPSPQQRAPHSFNGRPTLSQLGSVPEDGTIRQQQPPPPPNQQPQQQVGQLQRQTSLRQPEPGQAGQLHPEIRSVVGLVNAHAHKVYFSGPLIERKERQPDGQRNFKDESWIDVWAQLGGTTLSIWDMRAIEEASKQGKEVPPTYINIQDAFVQVVGSVTVPGQGDVPPKRYTDVLTLNTAGSNLFLFSCPDSQSLVSWASALRLAAWEKARLEEIYTAHLLRMSLSENGQWKDPKSTLVKGRLEGWCKLRVAGQTDWKRLWMVVTAGYSSDGSGRPTSPTPPAKKNRVSALFARSSSPPPDSEHLRPTLAFFAGNKGRERKQQVISVTSISQAFAVYPERPEMIAHSTLFKIEGVIGSEEQAAGMKGREGWLLVMPEAESERVAALEMLKWVVALHDAFALYGRPQGYTWDPREPQSMMFAYPVGPLRDHLFLDRELAEGLDPRDDRTSFIRSQLLGVQVRRMRGLPVQIGQHPSQVLPSPGTSVLNGPQTPSAGQNNEAPTLPPIAGLSDPAQRPSQAQAALQPTPQQQSQLQQLQQELQQRPVQQPQSPPQSQSPPKVSGSPQLPPLAFGASAAGPSNSQTNLAAPPGGPSTPSTGHGLPYDHSPAASQNSLQPPPAVAPPPRPSSPGTTNARAFQSVPRSPTPTGMRQQSFTGAPIVASPTSSVHSFQNRPSFDGLPAPHTGSSAIVAGAGMNRGEIATPMVLPKPPPMGAGPEVVPPPAPATPSTPRSMAASPQPSQLHTPQPSSMTSVSSSVPAQQQQQQQQQHQQPPLTPGEKVSQPNYADEVTAARMYMRQTPHSTQDSLPSSVTASREFTVDATDSDYAISPIDRPPPSIATTGSRYSVDSLAPGKRVSMNLARKPSGARALPVGRRVGPHASSGSVTADRREPLPPVQASPTPPPEEEEYSDYARDPTPPPAPAPARAPLQIHQPTASNSMQTDDNSDALAALSFLDRDPEPEPNRFARATSPATRPLAVVNKGISPPSPAPSSVADSQRIGTPTSAQYPSSFTQSKAAQEREAQRVARQVASQRPGRPNGRSTGTGGNRAQGWQSSDEEEEEEDDEDDDDGSDGPPRSAVLPPRLQQQQQQEASAAGGDPYGAQQGPDPRSRQMQDSYQQHMYPQHPQQPQIGGQRPPRILPQIPGGDGRSPVGSAHGHQTPPRGYDDASPSRPNTHYGYDDERGSHLRPHQQPSAMPPSRQTVWSSVLDPSAPQPVVNAPHGRETFIQLEQSETMTKAFTPQGLLQAGMQDKQDRSAKKQEEIARETGASLINVPNKPPPPQTGLLGAVTAHERERRREGGLGAALTEREREKRVAEERQRKIDDLSRQQLEQLGNGGGSVYNMQMGGGSPQAGFPPGYNPMMYMNPMMGYMGFPGMMPGMGGMPPQMGGMPPQMGGGYQPQAQQMWAAQQAAAEAYQRTMMSFSVAGSQAGDSPEGNGPAASPSVHQQMPSGAQAPSPQQQQQWSQFGMMNPMGGMGMYNPMMGMPGMLPPWAGSAPPSDFGGGSPRPMSAAHGGGASPGGQSPMLGPRRVDSSPARGGSPAQ